MFVSSARSAARPPLQVPFTSVRLSGEVPPSPKLVVSLSRTTPLKPLTVLPCGSTARSVIASGAPAVKCFWLMVLNTKPWSTSACTLALVPSGMVLSVWSCTNIVNEPLALSVTLNDPVPLASCAGAGSVALASDDNTWTVFVTEVTRVQVLSQAFTVIVNGTPTVCARGSPVLPEGVPGAAVSPGSSTWSRVYGPAEAGAASIAASDAASANVVAPERSAETSERTMHTPRGGARAVTDIRPTGRALIDVSKNPRTRSLVFVLVVVLETGPRGRRVSHGTCPRASCSEPGVPRCVRNLFRHTMSRPCRERSKWNAEGSSPRARATFRVQDACVTSCAHCKSAVRP